MRSALPSAASHARYFAVRSAVGCAVNPARGRRRPRTILTPGAALLVLLLAGGCAWMTRGSARTAGPDYAGTWEGSLTLSDSSGEVRLEAAKESGEYAGRVSLSLQGYLDTSALHRVAAEGDTLTFWLYFEVFDVDVLCRVWLEADLMKGRVEAADADGDLSDEGTVTLRKKIGEPVSRSAGS